jgi:hypothetical protein
MVAAVATEAAREVAATASEADVAANAPRPMVSTAQKVCAAGVRATLERTIGTGAILVNNNNVHQ